MPGQTLTVVVIAYNEEKFIGGVLSSLARQTERDFEVLVVDSNSTDGTEAAARAYAPELPAFRYLKLDAARGPAYGRNRGAEAAASERLLFLDADTLFAPDFLAATGAEIARLGADVATCPLRVIESAPLYGLGTLFLNGAVRLLRPVYPTAYGACLFSTRTVHTAVGGFDERVGICEDCHYVKKAGQLGFRFRILHHPFETSDRRVRRQGTARAALFYLRIHLRRLLTGREILKESVRYPYGQFG